MSAVLEAAEREIGVREDPPGSNRGKRVEFYQSLTWLPGSGWPWCVAFAWCFCVWYKTLRTKNPYPTASVEQLEAWARAHGWAVNGPPQPGDLLCLNHGQHVTICAVPPRNGYVKCLGGNQRDQVCYSEYKLSSVTTIVRVPKRLTKKNTPAEKAAPRYEVVKGEGEKARVVFTGRLGKAQQVAGNALRAGARVVRIRRKP